MELASVKKKENVSNKQHDRCNARARAQFARNEIEKLGVRANCEHRFWKKKDSN